MLERVAMHQTRLRLPGLGIDSKGVALGSRGLVLLSSIERLVAFLSLYTTTQSLSDVIHGMQIDVVRSRLNTRELILSFAAQSSERMDRIAEVARVAQGHTFTGTSRHFVQFRDAMAPFGYDTAEVLAADGDFILYHSMFSQVYQRERQIDFASLLMQLRPFPDPSAGAEGGASWLVAEEGLGPAVIQYFVRSRVKASVGVAEWPPLSALDDGPVRRFLFDVPEIPARMLPMLKTTPGLALFKIAAPGAAVQVGFRHPIMLRACPIFEEEGLVLFRGEEGPLIIPRIPPLGLVTAFARVGFHQAGVVAIGSVDPSKLEISVPIRLLPSVEPWRGITASFVTLEDYPLLRRIVYFLGSDTLRRATIAFTKSGAFLLNPTGVESTPVGYFMRELRSGLYVMAGYDPVPSLSPDELHQTLGAPVDHVVFLLPGQPFIGVPRSGFVSLVDAMIEGHSWSPIETIDIQSALSTKVPRLSFDPPQGSNQPSG